MDAKLVATSFDQVWPHAHAFAAEFYRRLFADDPALEDLFEPSRMARQYRKMISILDLVIGQAESDDADAAINDVAIYLQALGERHARYGALPEHFPKVGAALEATFAAHLGDKWTDAHRASWNALYQKVSDALLAGMVQEAAAT
jgi:nitric oxide dioxygenase